MDTRVILYYLSFTYTNDMVIIPWYTNYPWVTIFWGSF